MPNYAPAVMEQTDDLTLEVDLFDWIEQHRNVSLPDDEYPRASTRTANSW